MRNIFLATTSNLFSVFECGKALVLFLLLPVCLALPISAGQIDQPSTVDNMNFPDSQEIRNGVMTSGDACSARNSIMTSGDACPTREEVVSKTRILQMPFIANNGQVDELVLFYAKTFGGTVFVTNEGEIVYALPEARGGRDVPAGASQGLGRGHEAGGLGGGGAEGQGGKVGWHGQASLVRAESEFLVASAYSPLLRADNANCPPERVIANALRAAYLQGLQKETTRRVVCPLSMPPNYNPQQKSKIQNPQSSIRGVAIKETITGAKIGGITGEQPSVTTVNYFKGKDKSKWKTNVPTYDMVNLGEVYNGVELSLKAYGDNVEKIFCVKPGACPALIKVHIGGSKSLHVNPDGQLEVDTELGPVKFTRPIAYQVIEGKRVGVAVEYYIHVSGIEGTEDSGAGVQRGRGEIETPNSKPETKNPKHTYGFTVASYDKTKDLIIDPLLASTFLGGSREDIGNSLALDTSGNVYVTGYTDSTDFPTTSGAYDTSYNDSDVFVSKLNSGLTSLLASTFLGGSSWWEYGNALALDTSGNVYVTGYTDSTDFPTTNGVYDTSFNGHADVFITKLNSGLTSLLASTFLGGYYHESATSLTLDTSGNVYVTGWTDSTGFPTTNDGYDTSFNGGEEVFVSKLDSGLASLLASTFLGGSDTDYGNYLALDSNGNVYVSGWTYSTGFPTTSGAYDTSNSGSLDIFITKLNSGLTNLLASTYLGGGSYEFVKSLTLDTSGNVYVTGRTYSSNFPTTPGAYDTTFNGGYYDVFISKLDGGLENLLASTFLGGSDDDSRGHSIALDTNGNIYVAGETDARDFPTTSGAYDTFFNGGVDVFVSKFNDGLTSLLASTLLGGPAGDVCNFLTLNTSGDIYLTGYTYSTSFPVTNGAYDTSLNNGLYKDVFISKLDGDLSATDGCVAESITASPARLTIMKNEHPVVNITVAGADDCQVGGVMVTATINGNGKNIISVLPRSQETDVNGQAAFAINPKGKKGTAIVRFRASGLDEFTTIQVKVR